MTGKHSTKTRKQQPELIQPAASGWEMPDPDNLHIDLSTLPKTGPIVVPRRD